MNENLSSLIDGELSTEDAVDTLDRLITDRAAMEKWRRYHLIRDVLNGYVASSDSAYEKSLSVAVNHRLETDATGRNSLRSIPALQPEDVVRSDDLALDQSHVETLTKSEELSSTIVTELRPTESSKPHSERRTWITGFAMAASVAVVVMAGLRFITPEADLSGDRAAGQTLVVADSNRDWNNNLQQRDLRWTQSGVPVVSNGQAQLNALLVRHGEFIPVSSMNGLSGYARFVSFDERSN